MLKRILVALSGTPFTHAAVEHAIELARIHTAELTGVTLVDTERLESVGPVPIGGGAAANVLAEHRVHETEERVNRVVADFEAACGGREIPHRVVRERGDVFEQLIANWRYHDLTIFGLRGLFEYGVVHNPDDQITRLIARGVRPILAVSEAYRPVRRVLIAYNGSLESAKAMKRFVQMHPWRQSDLVLKVVQFDDGHKAPENLLPDAATYCRAHGFDPETERVAGDARHGLLAHAEAWNADLLVLGASNRGRLAKMIMGDTVLECVRHASMPLFLAQ